MDPNAQQQGATGGGQATNPPTNNSAGTEDYGDKGLDFLEKKSGHTMDRSTNEKITDGARSMFEKATGKQVGDKYSN